MFRTSSSCSSSLMNSSFAGGSLEPNDSEGGEGGKRDGALGDDLPSILENSRSRYFIFSTTVTWLKSGR